MYLPFMLILKDQVCRGRLSLCFLPRLLHLTATRLATSIPAGGQEIVQEGRSGCTMCASPAEGNHRHLPPLVFE